MERLQVFLCLTNLGNVVQENVGGSWGGTCLCPDGSSYEVGDNADACGSISCINGRQIDCNHKYGEWSGRTVTCAAKRHGKIFSLLIRYQQ